MSNLTNGGNMTVDHERVKEIREEIWRLAQGVRGMKRKTLPTFGVWQALFALGCRANGMIIEEEKDGQ